MKKSLKVSHFYHLVFSLLMAVSMVACVARTSNQENTGEYMNNSLLTTKVKTQLLAEPSIKSLPITVTSYKSVVQLSGFVESEDQALRAVKITLAVPGVTKVEDHLSVRAKSVAQL